MGAKSTGSHPTTTKADGHLLEYFRQNFGVGGGAALPTPPVGMVASGGIISDYTSGPAIYRAHIFTSSGTFDVTALGDFGDTVDALLVGGGGGGAKYGGGGGVGAVVHVETKPISTGPNTIVVASGGVGGRADGSGSSPIPAAADGGTTTFLGYSATGGGGAGGYNNQE